MTARFLSLHAIQSLPAGLYNRDDTGAIKQIRVGGTNRIRVSSQSWKRALRTHLRQRGIDGGAFAVRTTRLPAAVAAALTSRGHDQDQATIAAAAVFEALNIAMNDKTGNTKVLLFADENASERIADVLSPRLDDLTAPDHVDPDVKAAVTAAFDITNTVDIALFGRMLAELPGKNIDAAAAVAHPFSVHPAAIEADFFTAVDDLAGHGDAVSGMLDTADLAAAVLYRHVCLDRDQLLRNLAHADNPAELAAAAEQAFITAFLHAAPSAKRASSAATTLPAVILAVSSDRDTSLADAYTTALAGTDVLEQAVTGLLEHHQRTARFLPDDTAAAVLPVTYPADKLPTGTVPVVDTISELTAATARLARVPVDA